MPNIDHLNLGCWWEALIEAFNFTRHFDTIYLVAIHNVCHLKIGNFWLPLVKVIYNSHYRNGVPAMFTS